MKETKSSVLRITYWLPSSDPVHIELGKDIVMNGDESDEQIKKAINTAMDVIRSEHGKRVKLLSAYLETTTRRYF